MNNNFPSCPTKLLTHINIANKKIQLSFFVDIRHGQVAMQNCVCFFFFASTHHMAWQYENKNVKRQLWFIKMITATFNFAVMTDRGACHWRNQWFAAPITCISVLHIRSTLLFMFTVSCISINAKFSYMKLDREISKVKYLKIYRINRLITMLQGCR